MQFAYNNQSISKVKKRKVVNPCPPAGHLLKILHGVVFIYYKKALYLEIVTGLYMNLFRYSSYRMIHTEFRKF